MRSQRRAHVCPHIYVLVHIQVIQNGIKWQNEKSERLILFYTLMWCFNNQFVLSRGERYNSMGLVDPL